MNPIQIHPVDWFNAFGIFKDIFKDEKDKCHFVSDSEVAYLDPTNLDASDFNKTTFKLLPSGQISVLKNNPFDISTGLLVSKFLLLSTIKFKGDFRAAESYVMYKLMDLEIPYCRIGCDYFKMISKKNRNGGKDIILRGWKKEEMKDDTGGKNILKIIPKYDDFCIVPDNINYSAVHDNCYNLYHKFSHTPFDKSVAPSQIPHTLNFLKHIFQEHFEIGLKYIKVLYEIPMQPLPIIVLVSEDNKTGKSTFINFIKLIFGENSVSISPHDLIDNFNDSYANKNIIMIDETFFEKKSATDKLKFLATAQHITVSTKFVQKYSIPFFGKIIMCSNKEKDFTQIDQKETRFWIRKIPEIKGQKNTNILNDLFGEIPKFIKYLTQLPKIDTLNDRLVFAESETHTAALSDVKEDSRTWLHKDIEIQLDRWFSENTGIAEFKANLSEIKDKILQNDKDIKLNYLKKVLIQEMKIPFNPNEYYVPFAEDSISGKNGATFKFTRKISEPIK